MRHDRARIKGDANREVGARPVCVDQMQHVVAGGLRGGNRNARSVGPGDDVNQSLFERRLERRRGAGYGNDLLLGGIEGEPVHRERKHSRRNLSQNDS